MSHSHLCCTFATATLFFVFSAHVDADDAPNRRFHEVPERGRTTRVHTRRNKSQQTNTYVRHDNHTLAR